MTTKIDHGMAVTATIVFACEAHREMWLVEHGFIPAKAWRMENPPKMVPTRFDYEQRKSNTNLVFVAGSVGPKES